MIRRRSFITLLGSAAAAWPVVARGQQATKPVIGYLSVQAATARPEFVNAFRRGLASEGFIEGQNVTIEYRASEDRPERLPELAADLVRRQVAAIATSGGPPAALAAKRATSVEIIFFFVRQPHEPTQSAIAGNAKRRSVWPGPPAVSRQGTMFVLPRLGPLGDGAGEPQSNGGAANLRKSGLARDQLIEVITARADAHADG